MKNPVALPTCTATLTDNTGLSLELEARNSGTEELRLPYYFGAGQFWTVKDDAGKDLPFNGIMAKRMSPEDVEASRPGEGYIRVAPGESHRMTVKLRFNSTQRQKPFSYTVHGHDVGIKPSPEGPRKMRCCSMKCWSIVVLVVGILSFGARWKIKNAGSGHLGVVKAFLMFEKHGKYGRSTAEEIVEQKGGNFKDTVSIVTGANTGLGLETARVIGKNGGTVVMACRTPSRCENGKAKINAEVEAGGGELRCMQVDLGSLASVDKFVENFLASGLALDYLVNNAGIMALPEFKTTTDGHERQWGVNHLGHFRLTTQLLDKLKQHAGRIVNLSSLAHARFTGSISEIPLTQATYDPEVAYGSSKLSNILFTRALRARLQGTAVRTTSGHPGVILTELSRHRLPPDSTAAKVLPIVGKIIASVYRSFFGEIPLKNIPQGTATTLCMMLDELPATGAAKLYHSDCLPGKVGENYFDQLVKVPDNSEQLWKISEKYVQQYLSKQKEQG